MVNLARFIVLAFVRRDVVRCAESNHQHAAAVLAARAEPGDVEAWRAVYRSLYGKSGSLCDAAEELTHGNVEGAAEVCWKAAGMSRAEWLVESASELSREAPL